jgi:hypothetical protein
MNGVLDAQYYLLPDTFRVLPQIDSLSSTVFNWYKGTIACFRLTEYMAYFSDFGRAVVPFLVVRDVRSVWNSLRTKHYGRNGTTAEDPPLRLRFRRFLADWEYCRQNDLPILQFENFAQNPREQLSTLCISLGLAWDEGMIRWKKPASEILNTQFGSPTFLEVKGSNLLSTLDPRLIGTRVDEIALGDLEWLEDTFSEFNRVYGYPAHLRGTDRPGWEEPNFKDTRRYRLLRPLYDVKHLLRK